MLDRIEELELVMLDMLELLTDELELCELEGRLSVTVRELIVKK